MKIAGKKLAPISLGCDKNRVDLEKMLAALKNAGIVFVDNVDDADIILINTCAFIAESRKESLANIIKALQEKKQNCEKIVVTGCINTLHKNDLQKLFPKVDAFVNIKDNKNIVNEIKKLYNDKTKHNSVQNEPRLISTPSHYAFLKIADGCENFCSYCTIPFIRGKYVSEPLESVVNEAKWLAENGVKEIILVAQDITKYGIDLYGKKSLCKLLKQLTKINELEWIRLLYCYPEEVDDELIKLIVKEEKICNYIDIPLQHVSDEILKKMNRKTNYCDIIKLIEKLKKNNISIRSTFITGFPSETKNDYAQLENFVLNYKLNNAGFFAYSKEKGTKAYYFKKQVPNFIKKKRLNKLQNLQYKIMQENAKSFVGKDLKVVIDDKIGEKTYIARSEFCAPEIDYYTKIESDEKLEIGNFYIAQITSTDNIDLIGKIK